MTKEEKIKEILDKRGYYNLDLVREIEEVYKEAETEQLILSDVSQQREQLKAFQNQYQSDNFSPYIHPFRVHTPNLLNETFVSACRPEDFAALQIPLNEFVKYLRTLTFRCAGLNDPVLNKIMIDMTLYEESDLSSKEYNQEMVDRVNKDYNDYLERKP